MSKFTSLAIVAVSLFTGSNDKPASPDKNGQMPVILNVLAGKIPSQRVLAGTIAERAGFEVGKRYLVSVTEGEADATYGRRFNFTNAGEVSALDTVKSLAELGAPVIVPTLGTEETTATAPDKETMRV